VCRGEGGSDLVEVVGEFVALDLQVHVLLHGLGIIVGDDGSHCCCCVSCECI
jgi:hypothetical protein